MSTLEQPSSGDLAPGGDVLAPPSTAPRRRSSRWRSGGWIAAAFVAGVGLVALLAPVLPLADPNQQDLLNVLGPVSAEHPLGTDDLGRDLASRLVWGVRTSMAAAIIAVSVAIVIGLPLGLLAGYLGGWVDVVIARLGDVVLTVPALILLLAAQSALKTGIEGQMVVLGLIFGPRIMRVIRGETLRLAASPFVAAGAMSGSRTPRLIARYIFPGVRAQLAVQTSYLLGLSLVVEAGISFLGIGVQAPRSSLGTLLVGASGLLATEPRVVLIPAAVLTLLILGLNVLGDHVATRRTT